MSAMILTLFVTLYISDTASGDSNADEFGWVVVCEVLDDEADAERLSEELGSLFGQYTGYLWIPDWASLSGYRGWLVYLGPFETSDFASQVACFILWKYPDTYAINVNGEEGRNTVHPTPADFSDFAGLAPPLSSFNLRGEMPYEWPFLPQEAHESAVPVLVHSYEEALDFLIDKLSEDGIYGSSFPEGLSFGLAYMDNFPEDVYRDYYDIAIREVHGPGGSGDPNTAPIVDRFRIYDRGEIIWFQPVIGMFVPYGEILGR
jgi:hypothetical protein